MACFQTTFFFAPHSVGRSVALLCPCPSGPRNCGQSAAPRFSDPTTTQSSVRRCFMAEGLGGVEAAGLLRRPAYRLGLERVNGPVARVDLAAAREPADDLDRHVVVAQDLATEADAGDALGGEDVLLGDG